MDKDKILAVHFFYLQEKNYDGNQVQIKYCYWGLTTFVSYLEILGFWIQAWSYGHKWWTQWRLGRPKTATTAEIVNKIHGLALEDRRI